MSSICEISCFKARLNGKCCGERILTIKKILPSWTLIVDCREWKKGLSRPPYSDLVIEKTEYELDACASYAAKSLFSFPVPEIESHLRCNLVSFL